MNWSFVLFGFALAVFAGSAFVSLLVKLRPQWSERRQRLTAAAFLPGVTVVATALGILLIANRAEGREMLGLAAAALATFGAGFALLAWIGGLVGATLTSRRKRR